MATKLISLFVLLYFVYNASAGTLRKRKVFADAMETMEIIEKEVQEIEDVKDEEKPTRQKSIADIDEAAHTEKLNVGNTHINKGGDLELTGEQVAIEEKDNKPGIRNDAITSAYKRWPTASDGKVYIPYFLDPAIRNDEWKMLGINKAIENYRTKSCIRWVPRTDKSKHYVRFINGSGCYSGLGMTVSRYDYKGYQEISIGDGCGEVGTVEHETFHCLGFFHEQERPDRDNTIKIQLDNLKDKAYANNFKKQNAAKVNQAGQPYDIDSLMQYKSTAFAKDGTYTIVKRKPLGGYIKGQHVGFSRIDLLQLNTIYPCPGAPKPGPNPGPKPKSKPAPKPVDGNWGPWTNRGACSVTCGAGTQRRTRVCDNPPATDGGATCAGSAYDDQACNLQACAAVRTTPGCVDKSNQCASWANSGYCFNPKSPGLSKFVSGECCLSCKRRTTK